MFERFEKLFQLPRNLYISGSPIILTAGVLLKDNKTENVLVQIKWHSVCKKIIKAVIVDIQAKDISGNLLQGVSNYQYLDLNIHNGMDFGVNKAIVMPNIFTRSFVLSKIKVVFGDDTIWESSGEMIPLPEERYLQDMLVDDELIKQYKYSTTNKAQYIPCQKEMLWMCSCGTWNGMDMCSNCSANRIGVFNFLSIPKLTESINSKHEEERIQKEEQEERNRVVREKKKKNTIIITIIVIIFIVMVGGIYVLSPTIKYNEMIKQSKQNISPYLDYIGEYIPEGESLILESDLYYNIQNVEFLDMVGEVSYQTDGERIISCTWISDGYFTEEKYNNKAVDLESYFEYGADVIQQSSEDKVWYSYYWDDLNTECSVALMHGYGYDPTGKIRIIWEKIGHAWEEATCYMPKNCWICGKTEGETLEHVWDDATCSLPKICTVCNKTDGNALGHTTGEWTLTKEATLTEVGIEEVFCSVCGESVDSRDTERKNPKVIGNSFNFTDEEFIEWINNMSTAYVDDSELGLSTMSDMNTSYAVTLSEGETGILILNHTDNESISAIMVYFEDWENAAALAIWIGEKIDSDFSAENAFYPIADGDSYTAADMTVFRMELERNFEVTALSTNEYLYNTLYSDGDVEDELVEISVETSDTLQEPSVHQHTYANISCTEEQVCSLCGEIASPLGHYWYYKTDMPVVCERCSMSYPCNVSFTYSQDCYGVLAGNENIRIDSISLFPEVHYTEYEDEVYVYILGTVEGYNSSNYSESITIEIGDRWNLGCALEFFVPSGAFVMSEWTILSDIYGNYYLDGNYPVNVLAY